MRDQGAVRIVVPASAARNAEHFAATRPAEKLMPARCRLLVDAGSKRIPDTGVAESITYTDENLGLGEFGGDELHAATLVSESLKGMGSRKTVGFGPAAPTDLRLT